MWSSRRWRIVRFVSHAAVMPHVDLVVTHGGMGTTQRALAAGRPLVVVPWGRDQSEAERVALGFREAGGATRAVELLEALLPSEDGLSR